MILDRSFPREKDYVQKNNIPLVIVGGTVEYHGPHCSYGCDTLVNLSRKYFFVKCKGQPMRVYCEKCAKERGYRGSTGKGN